MHVSNRRPICKRAKHQPNRTGFSLPVVARSQQPLRSDQRPDNAAACGLPDTVLEADLGTIGGHYDVNLTAPTIDEGFCPSRNLARSPSGRKLG